MHLEKFDGLATHVHYHPFCAILGDALDSLRLQEPCNSHQQSIILEKT